MRLQRTPSQRAFLLRLPTEYKNTQTHGLIFSFHGRGENGAAQEQLSKLSDPAKTPHHIVVYPDGIDKQWQGDPSAKTENVAFTLDMIESLSSQYCIDSNAIYATGMSNGGGF